MGVCGYEKKGVVLGNNSTFTLLSYLESEGINGESLRTAQLRPRESDFTTTMILSDTNSPLLELKKAGYSKENHKLAPRRKVRASTCKHDC